MLAHHLSRAPIAGIAAIAIIAVSGCASTQTVAVNTPDVEGAECTLTSPKMDTQVVRTPGSISLSVNYPEGRYDVKVRCRKEGYAEGVGVIVSHWGTPGYFARHPLPNCPPTNKWCPGSGSGSSEYDPSVSVSMVKKSAAPGEVEKPK